MKICILSIGRAGSTSLYNTIIRHLGKGYYCIGEPFNDKINRINKIEKNQFDLISKKENVLIKTILTHKPNGMDNDTFNDWIFTFFDKIILLDRLDKKSQAESFSFLIHTKKEEWHKKQFYDISLVPKNFIDEWTDRLENLKKTLLDLSIKYNNKIYHYEDIFVYKNKDVINEIFDYLEITMDENIVNEFILSDNCKVRLNEKNNKLL
jgi:hypothetical protein